MYVYVYYILYIIYQIYIVHGLVSNPFLVVVEAPIPRYAARIDTFQLWNQRDVAFEDLLEIPSGKRLHNYGKSPCLMGKSTISMAIFHSYVSLEGI